MAPTPRSISDALVLRNSLLSRRMPQLCFGTFDSPPGKRTVEACVLALQLGYRHIDTAQYYQNETEVGEAIQKSKLAREDVFVTTKILTPGDGPDATYATCLESVEKVGGKGGYVDCLLIHTPNVGEAKRKELWLAFERLYREGRAKAIGVSNFGKGHIERLKGVGEVWPPHVNQIELHPWHQQHEIVQYCRGNGIIVQAYCPIARNNKGNDPTLCRIARKFEATPNQVLIRWSLQKGWVPLIKSNNPEHIRNNCQVYGFDLSARDMSVLDGLDQGAAGALVQTVNND